MSRLLLLLLPLGGLFADVTSEDRIFVVNKLRTYCAACHALGDQRFIYSGDDEQVWKDILTLTSPVSKKIWARRIVEVLNWPTSSPPPFDQLLEPPDKDWMPKGAKRLSLAKDINNGVATRNRIIDLLRAALGE